MEPDWQRRIMAIRLIDLADWPGKNGRRYERGLCPVTERLFESELFYHMYLYAALRTPWVEEICQAFEKVWANREQLAKVEDDGSRAIRRS